MTRRTRLNPAFPKSDGDTRLRRPSNNRCAFIGDSIPAWGSTPSGQNTSFTNYAPWLGDTYMNHIAVETMQRVRWAGYFAVGGYKLNSIGSLLLPKVLAMNPLPGACVIAGGVNDVGAINAGTTTLAASAATLKTMVATLLGAGIVPILVTVGPSVGTEAATAKWNIFIRRYAAANGLTLIDYYSALADYQGRWLNSTYSGSTFVSSPYTVDGVHPTGLGHNAVTQQAITEGIPELFPPAGQILTSRSTADLSNMFNNGTINTGLLTTNTSGVGTGLTATGTGSAPSIVAPVSTDNLNGNWQQLQRTTGDSGQTQVYQIFSTGWSVGDTLAFSCRVQTTGISATGSTFSVYMQMTIPGGYVPPDSMVVAASGAITPGGVSVTTLYAGQNLWQSDVDGLVYVEFTIPPGTTGLLFDAAVYPVVTAGTAQLRVGELTLTNLTTGGLLL